MARKPRAVWLLKIRSSGEFVGTTLAPEDDAVVAYLTKAGAKYGKRCHEEQYGFDTDDLEIVKVDR